MSLSGENKEGREGPYKQDVLTGRGTPKADIVREVAWIYDCTSPNADKGGGGQKS